MVKNNIDGVTIKKKLVICPECRATLKSENYSHHMERVHGIGTQSKRQNRNGIVFVISVVLVLIIGGLWLYNTSLGNNQTSAANIIVPTITNVGATTTNTVAVTITKTTTPTVTNTIVSPGQGRIQEGIMQIPISEVGTSAKWYTYNSNGVNVRFFLVKGTDGKVHLAADACDVCYSLKRGYRQTGNVMTCNNCGQTFAINTIGTGNLSGGCWPSYIPMKLEGDQVSVKISDLDGKRPMFA